MKKSKNSSAVGRKVSLEEEGGVTLRKRDTEAMPPPSKPAPSFTSPYSFMRRSCTFVAESSLGLRKSASRTSFSGQSATPASSSRPSNKVVKDRKNLALQVRQKKDMLEATTSDRTGMSSQDNGSGGGRMSRLVGGLRAWSSTEDVRQSFMGVSRKVKQAFGRPDSGGRPETVRSNGAANTTASKRLSAITTVNSATKNAPTKAQASSKKVLKTSKTKNEKDCEGDRGQVSGRPGRLQASKTASGRPKSSIATTHNHLSSPDDKK